MKYILLAPFIVLPLLINYQFSDPTLLVRRTSLFSMLFLVLCIYHFTKTSTNNVSKSQLKWIFLFIAFIIYSIITSSFNSINFNESVWGVIYLIGWLSIAVSIILYADELFFNKVLITTSILGGCLSLASLLQAYGLFNIENFSSTSATFTNRNFWGMYLCFVIPASLYGIVSSKSIKNNLIHILMFTFSLCSLIHCRSRAAWLGVLCSIVLLILIYHQLIINWIKNSIKVKHIYGFIIFLVISFTFIYTEPEVENAPDYKKSIWSTLTSTNKNLNENKISKNTLGERIYLYNTTIDMIKDYPFFGVGYNNWRLNNPSYYGDYIHDENYLKLNQRPHNDILWITSESGFFGLLLFMSIVIIPLIFTFKKILYTEHNNKSILNGFILVSIISILIESLFDFPKQRTIPNLYLWSYLGYLTINIPSENILHTTKKHLIKKLLLFISFLIAVFSFLDYNSILNSRQMLQFKSQKEYDLAINKGKKALKYGKNVDNTGTPITFYLGVLEYQKGNITLSENYFNQSLKIYPDHLGTLENLMIIKAKSSQFEEAKVIMANLRNLYPKYYSPVVKMIKLYLQQNNITDAKLLIEVTNFDDATQNTKKIVDNLKNYIILHNGHD
ncbi:MAG: hypothetical protein CBB66_00450 [bacterium TMED6]|nr:MAG: hypothetical protein CBB66_00450 [bacterium TMED6]